MDEDLYVASGHDLREEDWRDINLIGAKVEAVNRTIDIHRDNGI